MASKLSSNLHHLDFRCQLNTLSYDIINMQMSFSVAKIWGSKSKNQIFYDIFFNTDISITNQDIAMKFFMAIFHINCEGSVSQIFHLGPSFILCYLENYVLKISKKLPDFCYKIKTKP